MISKLKLNKYIDLKIMLWCAGLVTCWRICLEVINQALVPYITAAPYAPTRGMLTTSFLPGLNRWLIYDGGWYSTIIVHGYVITDHLMAQETIAFYPLFPFTVKILTLITHIDYRIVGLGINFLLDILVAYAIYKLGALIREGTKKQNMKAGKLTAAIFFINPAAYFMAALYAEPMLVLLFTASVYLALKRKYWLSAAASGLASAAKGDGVILAVVLIIIFIQQEYKKGTQLSKFIKENTVKIASLFVVGIAGGLAYLVYLWQRFGSPLVGIEDEKYWSRSTHNFILTIAKNEYLKVFNPTNFGTRIDYLYHLYLMFIPFMIVFLLWLVIRRKFNLWLVVLSLGVLLLSLSSGLLLSLNRYILVLTPLLAYVTAAYCRSKRPHKDFYGKAAVLISVTLLVIFTASFLAVYFVG